MMTLHTSMTIKQVDVLEKTFAVLTPEGWVIPVWLKILRKQVQFNAIGDKVAWIYS